MAMLEVFVSHSHEDDAFCRQLVDALRRAGADAWYDEHNLGSGQLLDVIERELRARKVFLLVLSPAALRSQWVRDESKWAFTQLRREPERILLPIVAGPLEENDIWLFLQDFKRIEAPGVHPYSPEEAIRHTLYALSLPPAGEAPIAQVPEPTENADDLITRGKALQVQGDHAAALPFFQHATTLTPNSFDAWQQLGYTLWWLQRYDESLASTERALHLDPTSSPAWNNKGFALWSLKRYEEALAAYEQALFLDPKSAFAWTGKGNLLNNLKRYEEALAAHERALTLDPKLAVAWSNKGNALYNLKRYEEALAAYEQELALDPKNAFAWTGKSTTLHTMGRHREADEADAQARALQA